MESVHIVLIEPRIPHNTGAIGRLCMCGGATLHLIHPLGFRLSCKEIKRAGMDYWEYLHVCEWACLEELWEEYPLNAQHFFLTTKAKRFYHHVHFQRGAFLYFGREDAGIKREILLQYASQCIRIPIKKEARSLNLSNAVAITLYEALRQIDCNPST